MQRPAFLRTSEQRTTASVLLILLWAPAWMIPGVIIHQPWSMAAGAIMAGLPLLIGAGWLFWIVWRQADPVQRLLIALFMIFIVSVASVMGWGPYPDQY